MSITAKYEDGVFKPLEAVTIESGTIVQVYIPSTDKSSKTGSKSDIHGGFFGLWKDRSDIEDSVEYVNKLRSQPHV